MHAVHLDKRLNFAWAGGHLRPIRRPAESADFTRCGMTPANCENVNKSKGPDKCPGL